jgi:hypothetical protein
MIGTTIDVPDKPVGEAASLIIVLFSWFSFPGSIVPGEYHVDILD